MSRSDEDPWWTFGLIKNRRACYRKIALATEIPGAPLAGKVRQSLHNADKILEAAGHIVEEFLHQKLLVVLRFGLV